MNDPGDEGTAARRSVAEALVEQHARAVGEACMALLGSQSDAAEALEGVLREALPQLEADLSERQVRVRLLGLARQRCAARLEARSRKREPESESVGEEATPPSRARRLLGALRPTEREALVLRFQSELNLREVAEACGVDEATASVRVARGLEHLGVLIAKDGA